MTESQLDLLAFVVIILIALATIPFVLASERQQRGVLARKMADLPQLGYVLEYKRLRPHGRITQVWGRFAEAVPLYLHISNLDTVAALAGRLGVADLAVGHANFDKHFIVRSNKPALARALLTTEWCERLLAAGNVQLITLSPHHVIPPGRCDERERHHRRELWVVRVTGERSEAEAAPVIALGKDFADAVLAVCRNQPFDAADLQSAALEGR